MVEYRGQFVVDGLANGGFDIGVVDEFEIPLTSDKQLPSLDFGQRYAITNWLVNCIAKGFVIGPFLPDAVPQYLRPYKLSPVFTVPKPGIDDIVKKYRVVHHLSHPDKSDDSVNALIKRDWTTVK